MLGDILDFRVWKKSFFNLTDCWVFGWWLKLLSLQHFFWICHFWGGGISDFRVCKVFLPLDSSEVMGVMLVAGIIGTATRHRSLPLRVVPPAAAEENNWLPPKVSAFLCQFHPSHHHHHHHCHHPLQHHHHLLLLHHHRHHHCDFYLPLVERKRSHCIHLDLAQLLGKTAACQSIN